MDFHLEDPETILNSSWIGEYSKEMKLVWHEIVNLKTTLFILNRINKFPFTLFFPSIPLFWQVTIRSLYESSILIVSKLLFDDSKDSLTLLKLRNNVRNNIEFENVKIDFDKALKEINIGRACKNIKIKITVLRHKKIAHFDKNWNISLDVKSLNELIPNYNEIMEICDKINALFDLLCFSEKRSIEFVEYSSEIKRSKELDNETDIDKILDNIAKESPLLNMPEQQKEFWPHYKENLTENDIETLNVYRLKFKLPSI